jgi:hypothetical protein
MGGDTENPHRITALCGILWGHILDLDAVRSQRKRPSLERRLKVAHAVSQLSGAYLKAAEADAVLNAVPALQEQVQELLRASRNGQAAAPAQFTSGAVGRR